VVRSGAEAQGERRGHQRPWGSDTPGILRGAPHTHRAQHLHPCRATLSSPCMVCACDGSPCGRQWSLHAPWADKVRIAWCGDGWSPSPLTHDRRPGIGHQHMCLVETAGSPPGDLIVPSSWEERPMPDHLSPVPRDDRGSRGPGAILRRAYGTSRGWCRCSARLIGRHWWPVWPTCSPRIDVIGSSRNAAGTPGCCSGMVGIASATTPLP
jgi:hypothetical protein